MTDGCDAATSVIEAESLVHEAHVPSFNEAQQLKNPHILLESIQRRMKDKDKCFMQHAFLSVPHECCTARACVVAGVRHL